jgi:hypothetical protein
MHRKMSDIPSEGRYSLLALMIAVISILAIFGGATTQALAQCNWSTKTLLSHHTNAQPGLTAAGDRLVLGWAGSGDESFMNSMISFDGVNWFNQVSRTDFPQIAIGHGGTIDNPSPSGGLGMTYSPACGNVYASWRDNSNNMWATRSVDGINWETPRMIVSGTALSAPALRGDDGSLPIGFAVTIPNSSSATFLASKGKFNCDFSNIVFPSQAGFFDSSLQGGPSPDVWIPDSVAWTGALGTTKLSAITSGLPWAGITVELNNSRATLGSYWSNNGLAGTVNPNDGAPYLAWTCHDDKGGNCSPDSTGKINIHNVKTGAHLTCADWSIFNPAMTFFHGKIWIAWRARESDQTGFIHIASLNPF